MVVGGANHPGAVQLRLYLTLTPLAGTGLVTLDRVYPLTLGSNIGMVVE